MFFSDDPSLSEKDLPRMCAANFFLTLYTFMMPALLACFVEKSDDGAGLCALAVAAFAAGMYVPGPFLAFLVEAYSRKKVCLLSILALAAAAFLLPPAGFGRWLPPAFFVQGAAFAVFQGSMGSTLLNDLLPSDRRTRGDVAYAWAGRLGVPLGVAAGILLSGVLTWRQGCRMAALACVPAFLLVCKVGVPLKAPVKVSLLSSDRFFQPGSWPIFLNLLPAAALLGMGIGVMLLPVGGGAAFHATERVAFSLFFAGGAVAALWAQRVVFRDADERAEMASGLLLAAIALLLIGFPSKPFWNAAFGLLGLGGGLFSSRFLMYFLKFCGHCQRGTAQNTCRLGWQTGFAAGFALSAFAEGSFLFVSLLLSAVSLLLYFRLAHPWFLGHRDRGFKFRGY